MATDITQPRLVAAPEALHDRDGWAIWHSGIVDGPNGLQTTVDVVDTSGKDRICGPLWEIPDRPRSPIEVTARADLDEPVHPSASEDLSPAGARLHVRFGRFDRRLGPRPDNGPVQLTIQVHPVGVRIDRTLGVTLADGDPVTTGLPRPWLLAAPRLLHNADGWVLWHSGVVHDLRGLQATFEILDISGQDRVTGPGWDIPAFQPGPVDVAITHAGTQHAAVVAPSSTPRSYRVVTSLPQSVIGTDPLDRTRLEFSITIVPLNIQVHFVVAGE